MTLKEYTKKVNTLLKEERDRINSDPDTLFRAVHYDLTESHIEESVARTKRIREDWMLPDRS